MFPKPAKSGEFFISKGILNMEKKTDLRIRRTYKYLTDALFELLKEKNFDDITVGELCEKAMIRRATFYKHFAGKYEFLTFIIKDKQSEFEESYRPEIQSTDPRNFYINTFDKTLAFFEENMEMFRTILRSSSSGVLLQMLSDEVERGILKHLKQDEKAGAALSAQPEILSVMLTGAFIYVIRWWVLSEQPKGRKELLDTFAAVAINSF